MGAESILVAMQRDTVLKNTRRGEPLNQNLPKAVAPPAITLPTFDKSKVTPEAMASHVPRNGAFLYSLRETFNNFQWMRYNLTHWGAMARDLTAVRGWNFGIRDQLEYQLALKETILSKLFGETLISDANIGQDPFVRAGALWGLFLKPKLNAVKNPTRQTSPGGKSGGFRGDRKNGQHRGPQSFFPFHAR